MLKHFSTLIFSALLVFNAVAQQTSPGVINNGFYDDFASSEPYADSSGRGIYWWGKEKSNNSAIIVSRQDTGLVVNLTLPEGDYSPFGATLGINSSGTQNTVDLSEAAKVKMVVSNLSKYDLKVKVALQDNAGISTESYPEVLTDASSNAWKHEIYFVIGAGEKREIIKDLTGALGYDYSTAKVLYPDLAGVQNLVLTCVNNELNSSNAYFPFEINNATIKIHSILVGDMPDGEKDQLLSNTIKEDTTIVKNPIDTTPVPNEPGQGKNGFYYNPQSLNINWWGFKSNDGSYSTFTEDSTSLKVRFNKAKGNYDPIGLSFGNDSLGNPVTLNLMNAAQMEIALANPSIVGYKVLFGLTDINGKTATYLSSVAENYTKFWEHESSYILAPGEDTTLRMDLTGLLGFNFGIFQPEKIDLSRIRSFNITLVNKAQDPEDAYLPFPIDSATLEIKQIRVGSIELDNISQSNSFRVDAYLDLTTKYGCIDNAADNFDPSANKDNGSCYYSVVPSVVKGCIDPTALNYNELATLNNGSCILVQKTVENIPVLVKAGVEKRNTVIAEDVISNCEINFNKIIDSVQIASYSSINNTEVKIDWKVYQGGNIFIVSSIIDNKEVEAGDILKQKINCNSANMRTTASAEVMLVGELQEILFVTATTDNLVTNDKLIVYPNPVMEKLSVNITGNVEVYTMTGGKILNEKVEKGQQVDVSSWSQGVYIIKLISDSETVITNVVKQ